MSSSPEYRDFMVENKRAYIEAINSWPNCEPPEVFKDIPSLQKTLVHSTFLEEFVFWIARFKFPQKIESFTRAFGFEFLTLFQGMNVNIREMNHHVEYEPNSYYAAFSAELEGSASPLWNIVSHLRDNSTAYLTKNLLRHCRAQLSAYQSGLYLSALPVIDAVEVGETLPKVLQHRLRSLTDSLSYETKLVTLDDNPVSQNGMGIKTNHLDSMEHKLFEDAKKSYSALSNWVEKK